MAEKYDKYIINPPHLQMRMKADKSVIFDGLMVGKQLILSLPTVLGAS